MIVFYCGFRQPSLEYELERKRLELETQRMQDMMAKTLGPTSEVVRRREERILHLRKLDQRLAEINSLITSHANKTDAAAARPDPDEQLELARSAVRPEWPNDKDIWLSGSSLDLHLDDKNGHSVTSNHSFDWIFTKFCVFDIDGQSFS